MLVNESVWIEKALGGLAAGALSPLINLGSATGAYRTQVQPYIQSHVITPLHRRRVRVIHADLHAGEGVDVSVTGTLNVNPQPSTNHVCAAEDGNRGDLSRGNPRPGALAAA